MKQHGFSLLEVMVALAIFGLVITVILSNQAGLSASNRSAANMGSAAQIARCRMTELEEKLLKFGYPEIEEIDSSASCCDDKEQEPFRCQWRVEKVLLPRLPDSSGADGGFSPVAGFGDGKLPPEMTNPIGGAALNLDAGLQGLGQQMGPLGMGSMGSSMGAGGASGLLSMVFSIVYPALKVLFENSIRRVTVTLKWNEGFKERELTVVQYVTNPSRGGFASGYLGAADGGLPVRP